MSGSFGRASCLLRKLALELERVQYRLEVLLHRLIVVDIRRVEGNIVVHLVMLDAQCREMKQRAIIVGERGILLIPRATADGTLGSR